MDKKEIPQIRTENKIHLHDIRVNGFATNNALPGEQTTLLVCAGLTSDEPEFHVFMKNMGKVLAKRVREAGARLALDQASSLLLVTHEDGTADLYIHNIPLALEVLAKRDIAAGDVVYQSGIADVRRLQIPGLDLKPSDGIFLCFKVGWKFGLFFDIAANRTLDVDVLEKSLAKLYRQLAFEEAYLALGDPSLFGKLIKAGWFPFVEIIGAEFEVLMKSHADSFNSEAVEQDLLKKFNDERIDIIAKRWAGRPSLLTRKSILVPALDAFKRKDSVSCLKILLTEIEGIIQDMHIAEAGNGVGIQELLKYATQKGARKVGDPSSLLFPNEFLEYLSVYTFANFDPKNPKAGVMSRHSTGHGAATADAYTQVRALQAILTLDQLAFYL